MAGSPTGHRSVPPSSEVAAEEDQDWSDSSDRHEEPVIGRRGWVRLAWVGALVVVLVLLATLPPLVNVNRYQRRVTQAISGSIGRPVHFDSVRMHLLPLPGFTIQNFVVQEDPAFGVEPAMRANTVEARVRFASLWRRRVEISRIQLDAPSVNLVRRADGRWNLQEIVSQASQVQSAPTAQPRHGDVPRFPYVEAKGARINIKQGDSKLPYSLVDAKFALWLPNQEEWKLRLEGRPLRTDTDVSDVGTLRMEGTLGRQGDGVAAEKLALTAQLESTPMGEATKLLMGSDVGWRGSASAELHVHGAPGHLLLTTDLHLHNLRRADFVPRLPMSVDAHCEAQALGGFHQFHAVQCAIPTAQSTSLLDVVNLFANRGDRVVAAPDVLSLTAEIPDALHAESASAQVNLQRGSPAWALDWLRLFSTRLPQDLEVGGTIALHAVLDPGKGLANWTGTARCLCIFPAEKAPSRTSAGDAASTGDAGAPQRSTWTVDLSHAAAAPGAPANESVVVAADPAPSAVGGVSVVSASSTPAALDAQVASIPSGNHAIFGQISRSGYSLQYQSAETARYAAALLPTLGDGMPADLHGAAQAERAWGQPQAWTTPAATPARAPRRSRRR